MTEFIFSCVTCELISIHFKQEIHCKASLFKSILCAYLKKALRFRCIKVHINKFVIHIRILSQE